MATIWGDPFIVSTLRVPIMNLQADPLLDEWGNPTDSLTYMMISAKLKRSRRLRNEADISLPLQRQTVLYEGFVLEKSIQSDLIPGTKGTGYINGVSGDIQILPVGQSSINFLGKLLGEKLLIEFSQTVALA